MPSLETIEDKYKGDTERCLMKCLTLWLQKSDSARLPSWVTLANALRQIDEKAVSEKIIEMSKQVKVIFYVKVIFVYRLSTY